MTELMTTLVGLVSTLTGWRAGNVKDAEISLLKTKIEMIRESVVNLEKEKARLEDENRQMAEELAHHRATAETKEHRGALWVREATGRYGGSPRCPRCHNTMTPGDAWNTKVYQCGDPGCGHRAAFYENDIPQLLRELNADA